MFHILTKARKLVAQSLALLSLAVLAACGGTTIGGGPSINTSEPVPVALLVPGGSATPSDAVLAQDVENAVRLAMAELNGVQIDLRVYETAAQPDQAASMAVRAVNEGAKIIVGPVYAQSANAAGLAVASRGVNVLSLSNNTEIAGGNVFVLGATFQNTADRLARYAAQQGKSTAHVVHAIDPSGQAGRNAVTVAMSQAGGGVTSATAYALDQEAVINSVREISTALRENPTDLIFFTSNTAGALPILAQLLPENGVSNAVTQFVGLTRWDIPPQTLELSGLEGGWFAIPDPVTSSQFRSRYQTAYGSLPHPIVAAPAYDAIAAIGALVAAGNSDALSASGLTQGAGFQGVNGIFRLRSDGTNERGLAVATIENRQLKVIDPAPRSFSGFGF